MVVAALFPFCFIGISNVLIIYRIIHTRRETQHQLNVNQGNAGQDSQMTVLLLGKSIAFIVLNLPVCVGSVLYYQLPILDAFDQSKLDFALQFANMLMNANNVFNFWIYCATGSCFRREVSMILCSKSTTNLRSTE